MKAQPQNVHVLFANILKKKKKMCYEILKVIFWSETLQLIFSLALKRFSTASEQNTTAESNTTEQYLDRL